MQPTLKEAKATFSQWRSTKQSSKEHIPIELWDLAVQLTKNYSSHKVARTLGLNTSTLSKKCKSRKQAKVSTPKPSPQFLEIDFKPRTSGLHCHRIELERSDGHRMRLFAQPESPFEILELMNQFLRSGDVSVQ